MNESRDLIMNNDGENNKDKEEVQRQHRASRRCTDWTTTSLRDIKVRYSLLRHHWKVVVAVVFARSRSNSPPTIHCPNKYVH